MKVKGINKKKIRSWLARNVKSNVWKEANKEQWVQSVVVALLEGGMYELPSYYSKTGKPVQY